MFTLHCGIEFFIVFVQWSHAKECLFSNLTLKSYWSVQSPISWNIYNG